MNTAPEETIRFAEGMEHDLEEGWAKLTSRQQGGPPAKAFKELVQNALDSYPEEVPIQDRTGTIITGDRYIAMKDYGIGMTQEQISMLHTVGGTSKYGVNSLIGNFGIGFKQLFNFLLGTTQVRVTTVCESYSVEILFTVHDPKSVPDIEIKVLDEKLDYGTMVEVFFDNDNSAWECLREAKESLKYYPCRFTINGTESISEWDKARHSGAHFFSADGIDGFILPNIHYGESHITVLCKYEYISAHYLSSLMAGSTKPYNSIQDYAYKGTPYIPGLKIVVNSNDLNVVISRDSFYCDDAFGRLTNAVNEALLGYLADFLNTQSDRQLVLANLYSLRHKIVNYLNNPDAYNPEDATTRALKMLSEFKVFNIAEKRYAFSIRDIITKRTPELPLFYSPKQKNVNWLGRQFLHDFVIIPNRFTLDGGLRGFYDELFSALFKDTINLDTIHFNAGKLKDLVKRGIVNPESLSPKVTFRGNKHLNRQQKKLQDEINALLSNDIIIKAIANNFEMDIRHIQPAFFDVADGGMYITTGLFDSSGRPLVDEFITNIGDAGENEKTGKRHLNKTNILLGLNLRHPLISYLCTCKDPNRAAYSMTYLINQLVMCQRSLVPYSGFYRLNKTKLAKEMRTALLALMTGNNNEDKK